MTTLDFLYLSLAFGFLILVGGLSLLIYHFIGTLTVFRRVLEEVEDTTRDVQTVKNTLKLGGLTLAAKVLDLFNRR
jgi:hypothetical protein